MKHSVQRVVAVATFTFLLTVLALPAAAAPFGGAPTDGAWSAATFGQWIHSLWAGWLGGAEASAEPSEVTSVRGALKHQLDPDGVSSAGDDPESDDDATLSNDGTLDLSEPL